MLTPSTGEVNSFSGTIQDGDSQTALTLNGTGGLQILNGTNTYSGLTTITAGTLQLGDGSNVGSINNSSGVVVNDTLTFNNPGSSIFAPPISGSGNVIQMTGTVILTGASTFDGTTTIDPYATLQIGNGGSAGSFTGAGTIVNNGQLVFDLTSDTTLPANISGGGALIQNGTGMVVLTGNNTYNGGTLIQSGVVQFNGDNTVPTGVPGSVLINSPGAVAVADNGTLYNTVTGWLTSGLIAPTSNGAIALIGDSSESIDMTNYPLLSLGAVGTVNFTGQITPGSTNYNLGGGGGTLTYSSQLTDDGTFGSMGVNISGPGTVVFANNTNNYSGATLVSSGVLQGNGNVPATSTVQIAAAGVYDLAGVSQTIAGLADGPSDSGVVTNSGGGIGAAATLTLAPATGISNTFTGVIQDGNPGGQNVLDHGRPRHAGPRRLQYLYRHDDRQRRRAQYRRRGAYAAGFTVNSGGVLMVSGAGVIDNAGPITGTGIVNIPAGGSLTAANLNVGDIAGNGVFGTVQVAGGQFAAASGAYLIMGNLQITGGTATLADGQTMLVNGSDPTWSDPAGMGLRIAAGGTFNLSGGSLIINGTAGPSEISVGDSTIGGSGSGPAVFNLSGGTLYAGLFGSEAGNFGLNGGNTMGLVVGSYGTTGIFNQTGGLNIVHGYGYFAVGSDCWFDTSAAGGTGTYNLSGGILNTSEGAGNWGDYSKWSIVGFLGGSGTVNVSQSGVWQISDDTTYRPLAIATGDPVGEFTGPGTFGDVEITNGGQVYAHAGVMIGDVFATSGGGNFQGATGILNVAGGLLDAGGFPIYIGPGGSFTVSTGTLQNIGEIMNNVALDISTGTLISGTPQPLVMNANGLLLLNGPNNTYTGGTTINSGTVQVGNGYAPGSIGSGPIVNNSVLVLDGGVVAGSISGNGAVIQAGPGLTSLTAMTNTYTSPTIIAGGTLQVGGGATPLIHYNFIGTGSLCAASRYPMSAATVTTSMTTSPAPLMAPLPVPTATFPVR